MQVSITRHYRSARPLPMLRMEAGSPGDLHSYIILRATGCVEPITFISRSADDIRLQDGIDIGWAVPFNITVTGLDDVLHRIHRLLNIVYSSRQSRSITDHLWEALTPDGQAACNEISHIIHNTELEVGDIAEARTWFAPRMNEVVASYLISPNKTRCIVDFVRLAWDYHHVHLVGINDFITAVEVAATETLIASTQGHRKLAG